jgi:hypothetical protein
MSSSSDTCPDCHVAPGNVHRIGCDIEQCPYCGGQLISCDCGRKPPLDDRMPWSGLWPGAAECREFGWYAKLVEGRGWLPCAANEPGATEDLNRLYVEAWWNRKEKRFVLVEPKRHNRRRQ